VITVRKIVNIVKQDFVRISKGNYLLKGIIDMDSVNKIRIEKLINDELESAMTKYNKINSPYEGFSIILKEFEELNDDCNCFNVYLVKLMKLAKNNADKETFTEVVDYLEYYSLDMIKEAIQIAAMIKRYKIDVLSDKKEGTN